jgi:aryl-alcohol dehydrogenase (NADP+)
VGGEASIIDRVDNMQYINLGKTGMKVSRLCLGMMSYGSRQWREWILGEEEAKPFIKRALDIKLSEEETKQLEASYKPHPVLEHS